MGAEGRQEKTTPKVGGGGKPECESSGNKNTPPRYSAKAGAACSPGASLKES